MGDAVPARWSEPPDRRIPPPCRAIARVEEPPVVREYSILCGGSQQHLMPCTLALRRFLDPDHEACDGPIGSDKNLVGYPPRYMYNVANAHLPR